MTGGADAKVTFKGVQTALDYKAGTFVFDGTPTNEFTDITKDTNLVFNTKVAFNTLLPTAKLSTGKEGATVIFNAGTSSVEKTDNTTDGCFYAADNKTTPLAESNVKAKATYKLSSGAGIADGTATGWVEQTV